MAQALDRGNCGIARFRGKEAEVKPVSRRTDLSAVGAARKEFGAAEGPEGRASGRRASPMPYKADGTDELAKHSEVQCSVPEVNGAVVPGPFTFLLREICARGTPATAGTAASNDRCLGADLSRLGKRRKDFRPRRKSEGGAARARRVTTQQRP